MNNSNYRFMHHCTINSFPGSIVPIVNYRERDRRTSLITIDKPYFASRHRPSITIDRSAFVPHHQYRSRRSSCFVERPQGRHRNFISFEQDRKIGASIEKPSCSFHPTISFETPMESMEHSYGSLDSEPGKEFVIFIPNSYELVVVVVETNSENHKTNSSKYCRTIVAAMVPQE